MILSAYMQIFFALAQNWTHALKYAVLFYELPLKHFSCGLVNLSILLRYNLILFAPVLIIIIVY